MTQITRVPVGLQEFLGTQAQGKNPSELSQVVVPTVDQGLFLGIQQEKWAVSGWTPFAANASETITVPDNELWLVRSVAVLNRGGAAGDSYVVSVGINNNSNSQGPLNTHPIGEPYAFAQAAGGGVIYSSSEVPNVVTPPGTQIVFQAAQVQIAAGNFNPVAFVRYLELKV